MKPVTKLVRIRHGSHLYGTNTAQSDLDFKGVHLPSGQAIVLQRAEDVITNNTKTDQNTKNQAGDIDEQSYSLQKFFGMLAVGDTVATEILFAPEGAIVEVKGVEWELIQQIGKTLLNRQCQGFVGYCRRQAAQYGIKGSRMSAVKKLIDLLHLHSLGLVTTAKLGLVEDKLREFAEAEEHAEWVNIPSPNGSDMGHIRCCDRAMPMTATISEALKVYQKVWDNYGDRARAAMTNEGIDWKAVSHAVRVAQQAIELLTTGHITFPRPNADYLLRIKQGELPYSVISVELEELVEEVERVALNSSLPEVSDQALIDETVASYYRSQLS